MVVSNVFKFHPYLGKWSDLTNVFQRGWNHQLDIGLFLHNPNKSINPQNLMPRYSPGKTVVRWLHGHHHHCHVRLHCWVERLAGKLFGIKWAMKENTPGCWGYLLGMKSYQDHMGIIWNKPWNKDPVIKQPEWLPWKVSDWAPSLVVKKGCTSKAGYLLEVVYSSNILHYLLLMVQKSGDHQLIWCIIIIIFKSFIHPKVV